MAFCWAWGEGGGGGESRRVMGWTGWGVRGAVGPRPVFLCLPPRLVRSLLCVFPAFGWTGGGGAFPLDPPTRPWHCTSGCALD